jgi:hypothetical protein
VGLEVQDDRGESEMKHAPPARGFSLHEIRLNHIYCIYDD